MDSKNHFYIPYTVLNKYGKPVTKCQRRPATVSCYTYREEDVTCKQCLKVLLADKLNEASEIEKLMNPKKPKLFKLTKNGTRQTTIRKGTICGEAEK
jgi:hypothetical protein